ncbi:MAG: hypothetical protein KDA58_03735 [Planctomycetaceae bacterium]|nr:hypothetical protein [Planctomycetaceae bacterium]
MFTRLLIAWSRFALCAWVGAAALFVITGVKEVTSPAFESVVRDQLVLLRFPPYYVVGFALVGSALLALLLLSGVRHGTACSANSGCGCTRVPVFVTLACLAVMIADYVWVYSPLEAMITPPGSPRTAQFVTLHKASMYINMVHVGLALWAAWWLSMPVRPVTVSASGETGETPVSSPSR